MYLETFWIPKFYWLWIPLGKGEGAKNLYLLNNFLKKTLYSLDIKMWLKSLIPVQKILLNLLIKQGNTRSHSGSVPFLEVASIQIPESVIFTKRGKHPHKTLFMAIIKIFNSLSVDSPHELDKVSPLPLTNNLNNPSSFFLDKVNLEIGFRSRTLKKYSYVPKKKWLSLVIHPPPFPACSSHLCRREFLYFGEK